MISTAKEICLKAADNFQKMKWAQGTYYTGTGVNGMPTACCLVGALRLASSQVTEEERCEEYEAVCMLMADTLGILDEGHDLDAIERELEKWNDETAEYKSEVVDALRKAGNA